MRPPQIVWEFQNYIYMLNNNGIENSPYDVRYDIINKTSQDILYDTPEQNNDSVYIYGMLPVDMISAAYISFKYDNPDINFNLLSSDNTIPNSYYISNLFDCNEGEVESKKSEMKNALRDCIVNKINNPLSIYNSFNINMMMVFISLFWFILFILLMKVLHLYYRNIYSFIIFIFISFLLLFGIVWKMLYTLQ